MQKLLSSTITFLGSIIQNSLKSVILNTKMTSQTKIYSFLVTAHFLKIVTISDLFSTTKALDLHISPTVLNMTCLLNSKMVMRLLIKCLKGRINMSNFINSQSWMYLAQNKNFSNILTVKMLLRSLRKKTIWTKV